MFENPNHVASLTSMGLSSYTAFGNPTMLCLHPPAASHSDTLIEIAQAAF